MSDSETGSITHKTRPGWTRYRTPGVNDIRNKVCWICREEEATEVPHRTWIHPCDCTLVAHETCLLTWIRMQHSAATPNSDALKCPQCKTPFEIRTRESKPLQWLEFLHLQVSRAARFSTVAVAGGSLLALSTAYGVWALRCFVGRDVANLVLGGEDPRQWRLIAWLNLPAIPFALLLSSTKFFGAFSTLLPFILAPPLYPSDTDGTRLIYPLHTANDILMYPPSPPLILAVFPLVRHLYKKAHAAIVRHLVKSATLIPSARTLPAPGENNNPPDPTVVEVERELEQNVAAALDRGEPVTLTMDALSRLFIGSLALPPISALMGQVLLGVSTFSKTMRTFLGVDTLPPVDIAPISGGLMDIVKIGMGITLCRRKSYGDFDPVWWRNALGLSIYVVGRDAITLWRRYLRVQEKRSRIVVSKPFTKVDYDELDFIPE